MNTSYARKGRVPLQVALCAQQAQQPDLPSLTCLVVEMVRTFESGFERASHLDAQDVETRGNEYTTKATVSRIAHVWMFFPWRCVCRPTLERSRWQTRSMHICM